MSIACKVRPIGGEALLPDGYRRCEYLESTGTQIISTDIRLGVESEIQGVFQNISTAGVAKFAGSWVGSGRFAIYQINNNSVAFYIGDNGTGMPVAVNTLEKMKIIFNIHKATVNANEISLPKVGFTTESTCTLFDRTYYRVYSFSISRNNQLQLNFIPCLDDKGKPCMFDTVSRTSYYNYNNGSGDFLYKLKTPITRKLPHGYQPLEYLESTGAQYIDTGITATKDTGLYAEWMFNGQGGNQNQHVLSCLNLYCPRPRKVDNVWVAQGTLGPGPATNFELTFGKKNIASTNFQNSRTINFNETSVMVSEVSGSIQDKVILYGYSDLSNGYLFYGRIYSAKISEGTEIVRDFVPCLDLTGKPCMWDYVTRRPFYNQDTTGPDFLYG